MRPMPTTSSTVSSAAVFLSVSTTPIFSESSRGEYSPMGFPSIRTSPRRAGWNPDSVRMSVLLPTPLAPTRHAMVPLVSEASSVSATIRRLASSSYPIYRSCSSSFIVQR